MKKQYINESFPHFLYGGDYNPEQWIQYPEVLAEDMRLMKLANCNEMSIGIFSWSTLEPEEGKFDFSFLDKAMDDIYKAGGRVILATPSGARPAWLSQKYPEVLRFDRNFSQQHHGFRHNHCYTSPVYREKVSIINQKLAQRYRNHPALFAWHISNEYGGECYCPNCQAAFREWLKEKYGTPDNLNHAWWSTFWSHTYTDWQQIEPPSPLGENDTHGLNLDWKRFVTHQTADFMKHEIAAVRKFTPDIPVTTNLMGFFPGLDYRELTKSLDFISNDLYPMWKGQEKSDIQSAKQAGMIHDLMRSLKHKSFLLMESTPSLLNWHEYNKLKRPGMNELSSMQAIAHGADSVQYFQWRKSRGASEKFHGAVVDHAGHENTRVFQEVSRLGARLKGLDEIVGTAVHAEAALLYDWSNHWALDDSRGFCRNHKKLLETLEAFYSPLWENGINTDVIGFEDNFNDYKLIIAPMLYSVPEKVGERLKQYVKNGGILLCTYMTAMTDETDLCYLGGFPGAGLREVFGIWNEEIDTLYPEDKNTVLLNDGTVIDAVDYCELIHAETAQVIARYDSDFYQGRPAATVNQYGDGLAYYVAFRDTGEFTDKLVGELLQKAGINSCFDSALPSGVTAHTRTDGETVYLFLQNFTHSAQTLTVAREWEDPEGKMPSSQTIVLQPLQTVIFKGTDTKKL